MRGDGGDRKGTMICEHSYHNSFNSKGKFGSKLLVSPSIHLSLHILTFEISKTECLIIANFGRSLLSLIKFLRAHDKPHSLLPLDRHIHQPRYSS